MTTVAEALGKAIAHSHSPVRADNHGHSAGMRTEIYIEALLADEELADQVWKAWLQAKPTMKPPV